jgi:hypothetical protein
VAEGKGDGRPECRAERRADLAAGVDDAADHALIRCGHPAAGGDHGPERGPGRSEADQHYPRHHRAVVATHRKPGEQEEPCRGGGAGEHEHAPDADPGAQPRCPAGVPGGRGDATR